MLYPELIEKWLNDGEGEDLKAPRWQVAREIEDLNSPYAKDNLAQWYALSLEEALHWHGTWSGRQFKTVDDFKAAVVASRTEMEEWREDDLSYSGWADDECKTVEAFLTKVTPFQVYLLVQEFKARLIERVEDELMGIITRDATNEQSFAEKAWSEVITAFLKAEGLE